VKTISEALVPKISATTSREFSMAALAFCPAAWVADGFPHTPPKKGSIASAVPG